MEPFNPFLAEMRTDPYPAYRRLREEEPVHYSSVVKSWVLSRHADVLAFFSDHEQLSSDRRKAAKYRGPRTDGLAGFQSDGPQHTRYRNLTVKAFSPRVIDSMRKRIEEIVDVLLSRFDGEADLISGFARPLPMIVISEILGVPASDHEQFHKWGHEFAATTDHAYKGLGGGAGPEMARYFAQLVPERRREPRDDLMTQLIQTTENGDSLDDGEIISALVSLLFAGHETTVNLIGNGMLSLLRNREQFECVLNEEVARPTVEELLRYESPAQIISRSAICDVEFGDKTIREGDSVIGLLGAANRDPALFEDPDALNVSRDPNPHVAFGHGVHFCIGAMLSRLEGRIAIPALVRHFPSMKPVSDEADWRDTAVLRGLNSLRVSL